MGGEKPAVAAHVRAQLGSPPRGRGKGQPIPRAGACTGITPAWAGKSNSEIVFTTQGKDHPRVGGEKLGRVAAFTPFRGSPPRGRGKD